jgi:hypothetical protein
MNALNAVRMAATKWQESRQKVTGNLLTFFKDR